MTRLPAFADAVLRVAHPASVSPRSPAILAMAVWLTAQPAVAASGQEERYGGMTFTDGSTCDVTLITYEGDPERVSLKATTHLPDGRTATAPVSASIGTWRKVMYPKGNMDLIRFVCDGMNQQLRLMQARKK